MTIDILHLREERGGNPAVVFDSERRRGRDGRTVEELMDTDRRWRSETYRLEELRRELNDVTKKIGARKKANSADKCDDLVSKTAEIKAKLQEVETLVAETAGSRESLLHKIGNLVHPSVPVSNDEVNNMVVRTWGVPNKLEIDGSPGKMHHHQILSKLLGVDFKKGVEAAGHRGYYLKGPGVMLNMALVQYGLTFLMRKGYTPVQPPYFMRKQVMSAAAELKDFQETLYRIPHEHSSPDQQLQKQHTPHAKGTTVGGNKQSDAVDRDDMFLIATSEQPLCALHAGDNLEPRQLPIRYAGVSTCFRKEAGSHGKDCWGIFRVHQFEKVEQFCICDPEKSWEMHEEMIAAAEEFYQSLELPYRVVSIVSGALNDAAAKKYDLEAWFPGYNDFRELVSCSNCTDYQSRDLDIRFGFTQKHGSDAKRFVHLLNATLVASQRCLCCILENYQTPAGVRVPRALVPFMGGQEFLHYPDVEVEKREG